jgi:adenosylcobalamin-dependent ribonucleoside-triphosphate reductase
MTDFKIIPGGRHLWASGVKGRQYLFNCHVSHWGEAVTDHFSFTFLRLMEGGGVGANYSNRYLEQYVNIQGHANKTFWKGHVEPYNLHIVCDSEHPDYQTMKDAGLLSAEYVSDWDGCYAVDDSREGWADALTDLISTYYRPAKNQNRVFDVSRVRPRGAKLHTFGGTASGPAPLAQMLHEVTDVMNARIGAKLDGIGAMEIDHAIATCVVSGGVRRSARMSIMHWADPQIF